MKGQERVGLGSNLNYIYHVFSLLPLVLWFYGHRSSRQVLLKIRFVHTHNRKTYI